MNNISRNDLKEYYTYSAKIIDDFENGDAIHILCENGKWQKVSNSWANSFDIFNNVYVNQKDLEKMSTNLKSVINQRCNETRNLKTYKLTKDKSVFQRNFDYLTELRII